jgi:hypothetical protein
MYGEKGSAHPNQVWLLNMGGTTDYVPIPKPITPAKSDH